METSVSIKCGILQLERGGNTLTYGNKCFYQVQNVTVGERREYLHLWKQVFLLSMEYYIWRQEGIPSSMEMSVSIECGMLQLEREGNTLTYGNKCFYQVWNVTVGERREYLDLWKHVFLSCMEYYSWSEEGIP